MKESVVFLCRKGKANLPRCLDSTCDTRRTGRLPREGSTLDQYIFWRYTENVTYDLMLPASSLLHTVHFRYLDPFEGWPNEWRIGSGIIRNSLVSLCLYLFWREMNSCRGLISVRLIRPTLFARCSICIITGPAHLYSQRAKLHFQLTQYVVGVYYSSADANDPGRTDRYEWSVMWITQVRSIFFS